MRKYTGDPVGLEHEFNELSLKINTLRDSTSKILNKYHGLNESKEYWWFVAGYYAVIAWTVLKRCEDSRHILRRLIDSGPLGGVIPLELNERLEELRIELKKKNLNTINYLNPSIVSTGYICLEPSSNTCRINNVYPSTTGLLYKFYLRLIKIHKKIIIRNRDSTDQDYDTSKANLDELFEELLLFFLPETLRNYFPRIFIKLAKYVNLKKVYTTHGLDLNIFQIMVIGSNFAKKGPGDWLNIVGHGFGSNISIDSLYYHSLQNKPQNAINYDVLKLPLFPIKNKKQFDVLLIPAERPLAYIYYDLGRYEVYERLCINLVRTLSSEKYSSLRIKVRFKNALDYDFKKNDYLQKNLMHEKRGFEESYSDYNLIITTNIASVAGKCIFNNIPFVGLYFPYELTEKKNYEWIIRNKDIYENFDQFIERVKTELDYIISKEDT